jgi:hypothetical protein
LGWLQAWLALGTYLLDWAVAVIMGSFLAHFEYVYFDQGNLFWL